MRLLISLIIFLPCLALAEDKDTKKKPKPKFTISKETTYVTGPLDKDGYIDYATALNERLSKGVTPENNANVLLWQALGPRPEGEAVPPEFFKWLGIKPPPQKGNYFIALDRFAKEHLKLDEEEAEKIQDQLDQAIKRPWTAKQFPHIAAWLKANEKPLVLVVEASKRPHYFSPIINPQTEKGPGGLMSTPLPTALKTRDMVKALSAHAFLYVREKRCDEAWQDLLACHRLARLVGRGGTLIEALVRGIVSGPSGRKRSATRRTGAYHCGTLCAHRGTLPAHRVHSDRA